MLTASFRQQAFRGRDDDVTLNSATFNGGGGLNTGWTQAVDTNFRVRFVVEETNGAGENVTWVVFYSLNGGTPAQVTTTTPIKVVDSAQFADDAATSSVLGGTGTFLAGFGDDLDAVMPSSGNQSWSGSQRTEHEICFQIDSAQVNNGDTISLQIRKSGGTAITYNQTPTITVSETVNVTLTAEAGAFAVSGQSAALRAGRRLAAAVGAFSLTGQDAGLVRGRRLPAAVGSFDLTGHAAALRLDRVLQAETGAIVVTGNAANLVHGGTGETLEAAVGSFAITGQAAGLRHGRVLTAETGSLAVTGQDAGGIRTRRLQAASGQFSLTGRAATLAYSGSPPAPKAKGRCRAMGLNLPMGTPMAANGVH